MVRNMENRDPGYRGSSFGVGYTDDMFMLQADIRRYSKFIATLVRLELVTVRNGQILSSNYGQQRFDELRNSGFML